MKLGMTQRDLARELGIHYVQLNAVIKGRRDDRIVTEAIWSWLRKIWGA
jgi:plasmid maintenance system antidote protein VapI